MASVDIPVLFIAAAILGIFNRKFSYIIIIVSSIYFIFKYFNFHILTSYFILIASIVWIIVGAYSLNYGKNYGEWLHILISVDVFGMSIILLSQNYLWLITGWEIMSISSYLIIGINKMVKGPAFIFMLFSEISTASLIISAIITFSISGTFNLEAPVTPAVYLLISIGAFIKMGMFPFMIAEWLPIAHGSAPANASAIFSATMTLMGVFLIYKMTLLITYDIYFQYIGLFFLITGAISLFFGSIYAYISENSKMLAGFSTIENQGAILMGFGLYLISTNYSIRDFVLITIIIYSLAHSLGKSNLFMAIGTSGTEEFTNLKSGNDILYNVGLFLVTLSLSGLFPTIGGLATWMLLESFFMQASLGGFMGAIAIIAGSVLAISEGMASGAMFKIVSFLTSKKNTKIYGKRWESAVIFSGGFFLIMLFIVSTMIIYSPFVGGVPSLYIANGFSIISKLNSNVFGILSPLYITGLILIIFLVNYSLFGKPRGRYVGAWNSGILAIENYTSFAYSNNIRLILKRLLQKRLNNSDQSYLVPDIFWIEMNKFAISLRKYSRSFSRLFMNSSILWYMIYMIISFLAIIIVVNL
ncbi:MAG: proton-conducting transporter membrane subunit [Thermoplasmata archaeon]|jgi:formate hydrogenlyase subunit 3/multisubunit Na+/H+ antiporter MnhD subunit